MEHDARIRARSDLAFNEAVQFIPTPGHTIDHYSVLIGRPGEDVLITGDMIHSRSRDAIPSSACALITTRRKPGKRAARYLTVSAMSPR